MRHSFETVWGRAALHWTARGVCGVELPPASAGPEDPPTPAIRRLARAIGTFLEGRPADLGAALDLEGTPRFARRVYEVLRRTPAGRTLSYGDLAVLAGTPGAARAVGSALRRNPVPLLVPCHRVLASGGRIGGFSAPGGLATKRRLLALEGWEEDVAARPVGAAR